MLGFGFYSKLALAFVLAAALAGGGFKAYSAGKANVQAEWNTNKLIVAAATLKATEEAFAESMRLQGVKDAAINNARKRETVLKADANLARDTAISLQDYLQSLRVQIPGFTREAVNKYASAATIVFNKCIKEYTNVAERADGFASESLMLQEAWPRP